MKITSLTSCTGCSACYSICGKSAITMTENSEGFLYPQIDASKCVKCKKCEKVCPVLNPKTADKTLKCPYVFINTNESIRYDSSSGGVFTALAEIIIRRGGKIFGAKYDDEFNVVHGFVDKEEDLEQFHGSKYTQSAVNESFIKCKEFLESGIEVLFSSTPCQIGGLKAFLNKDYDNLITVDFICHGVPSRLLWRKYMKFRENEYGAKVTRTSFRRKNDGWKKFSLWFAFANHNEYCQSLTKDPYMQMFLKDVCLRKSCYDCNFKTLERQSDITMADFWGIQQEFPELDDDKGVSFVVVNSEKGKALFDSVECGIKKSVPLESGLKHNPSMIKSVAMPNKRKTFFKDLEVLSFEKMVRKYAVTPWYVKGYRFVRWCAGKVLRVMGLRK
jgi:coenzyme F420-reducing hydrogenase beta subunit